MFVKGLIENVYFCHSISFGHLNLLSRETDNTWVSISLRAITNSLGKIIFKDFILRFIYPWNHFFVVFWYFRILFLNLTFMHQQIFNIDLELTSRMIIKEFGNISLYLIYRKLNLILINLIPYLIIPKVCTFRFIF